jgi:hypothetical protein
MPVKESEYHGGDQLDPQQFPRYGGLTVSTTTAKPEIAENGNEVLSR